MDTIEVKGERFLIDPLTAKNLSDLIPLYQQIFGVKHSLQTLQQKYDTTYLGESYFGHFARNEKLEPVAFHGAIPYRVNYGSSVALAAQYGDAMTLKAYAGRGFFTILGKKTDELLQARGISFVYGFPNQNSEYGYLNKMNWSYQVRMNLYKFRVGALPLEPLCRRWPWLYKHYRKWVNRKIKPYVLPHRVLKNSASAEDRPCTLRDEGYFKYKSYSPNVICQIGGSQAWIKIDTGLMVGDLELADDENAVQFLNNLKKLCRKLGMVSITFQWYPGTRPDQQFSKLQSPESSWVVGYCNFNSDWPVEDIVLTYGDLDTF